MGKQTFTTGQVLTASQMTNLQQTAMGGGSTTAKVASYVLVAADAGTVVQMNSASATTITVNTALFAAGDTVEIQNVGAGVCTVTAGTATVSTSSVLTLQQYDAGSLYFNSTSAAIFFASDAANSPLTTKGDLFTFTTADARLAVGNNGETLICDSSTATGLRYTPQGLSNPVINGGMDIWQRGTSFTVGNGVYLMDRWYNTGNASLTVTRDTDVPISPYFNYSAKLVGAGTQSIAQKIESAESTKLAGQVITISLYAKKTSGTGALNVNLYYPSATDNFASVTQIGSAFVLSSNPGSSWARYSVTTSALPADVQKGLLVLLDNINTHTIFITGVQIDVGSVALPFRRAGGTIQGELAAAQRYYYRANYQGLTAYANFGTGAASSTTQVRLDTFFPVSLRVAPTAIDYPTVSTNFNVLKYDDTAASPTAVAIDTNLSSVNVGRANWTVTTSVANVPYYCRGNNAVGAYLGWSAEL